eukprot:scaffold44519_cov40-Tisochrysis_lutea.AAC.3
MGFTSPLYSSAIRVAGAAGAGCGERGGVGGGGRPAAARHPTADSNCRPSQVHTLVRRLRP